MLKHVHVAVGIFEGHIPELNITLYRLPVLLFRIECIAVFFNDLGCVGNIRFFVKQIRESLYVYSD